MKTSRLAFFLYISFAGALSSCGNPLTSNFEQNSGSKLASMADSRFFATRVVSTSLGQRGGYGSPSLTLGQPRLYGSNALEFPRHKFVLM